MGSAIFAEVDWQLPYSADPRHFINNFMNFNSYGFLQVVLYIVSVSLEAVAKPPSGRLDVLHHGFAVLFGAPLD